MIAALLLVAVLTIGGIVYFQSRQMILNSIGTQALSIANKAVEMIDPAQYKELVDFGSEESPYYQQLREELNDLRDKTGSLYLYTMRKVDDKYLYMVDGMPADGDASAFGAEEDMENISENMMRGFEGEPVIGDLDDTEDWGKLISAYVPIKTTGGEILGVVGVDFKANEIYAFLQRSTGVIIWTLLIVLLIAQIVGYLVARGISSPLEKLAELSSKVRDGDLSVSVEGLKREDEIGSLYMAFGDMVENLRILVKKIQSQYEELVRGVQVLDKSAAFAEESMIAIAQSTQEVAVGSENQLSRLAAAVTEVSNMAAYLSKIEENSRKANELSYNAEERAEAGRKVLQSAKAQILTIDHQATDSANVIRSLSDHIVKVTSFMEAISGIARQTNLLALNAAIESARAGEAGRGFAVVAQEIRVLAEEAAAAAENVVHTVTEIYIQSSQAVDVIEKTVNEVRSGVIAIESAEKEFDRVFTTSHDVSTSVTHVTEAVESISTVSHQIKDGMERVSAVSEEANAVSEEVMDLVGRETENIELIKEQSKVLVQLAQNLREEIGRFRL